MEIPSEKNEETDPEEKRKTDPRADARYRKQILDRKRKRERMRKILIGVMALAVALVVLLAGSGIYALTKGKGHDEKENAGNTDKDGAVTALSQTAEPATEEPEGPSLPLQIEVQNEPVEDLESLDTELIDWGYGPDRDESNRPADVLYYQEIYGKYHAHFVVPTEEKIIYLTFDEGYETGNTGPILDILKETDCPAIFFVLMTYVEENRELVQRMIDEGHIVGNHSINHPNHGVAAESLEEQRKEVVEVHNYMLENYNYKMWLWRYPSGTFNEQSLALVNNLNYHSLFWSFACRDYDESSPMSASDMLQAALDELHPGAIYLFHAVNRGNAEMLKEFIIEARERGYEFGLFTGDPSVTVTSRAAVAPVKDAGGQQSE